MPVAPQHDDTRPARFVPKNIAPTLEQLAIQTAVDNTILVEANAGAAKTTTIALRLAESWSRGVPPANCLALTYTVAARDALGAALGKIGVPSQVVRQFRIETFESFARAVLAELDGGVVPIRPTAESLKEIVWAAIEAVAHEQRERGRQDFEIPSLGDNSAVESFLRANHNLKGRMLLAADADDQPATQDLADSLGCSYMHLRLFKAYERSRQPWHRDYPTFRGAFDATYDLATLILKDELPRNLGAWPARVRVLLVDEMHDMNQAMSLILTRLLDANCFFCGVGDVDQVIYSAAGADSKFMQGEIQRRGTRRITRYTLTSSFRFDATLAKAVSRFKAKPCVSASAHATHVTTLSYAGDDADSCERQVVQAILKWRSSREKLSGFAVLLRHPSQSVALENALLAANIPYVFAPGLDSYLMRPEILLIRGLLAVATDRFESIDVPQTRRKVVEAFVLFCDVRLQLQNCDHLSQREQLKQVVDAAADNKLILRDIFENHVLKGVDPTVAKRLREAVRIARMEAGPQLLARVIEALRLDLLAIAAFVESGRREEVQGNLRGLLQLSDRFSTPADFFMHLNESEARLRGLPASTTRVVLGLVESVKGLEFEHVALPYLRQGEFPCPSGTPLEEENLFYVGITRARRFLSLYVDRDFPSAFVRRLH
ncbi:ATP-dependent helicase [Variovorax rhizosphaerae]|uniref:DNA 3'-5' helicase n=1 Tax=Variovorax rhizosphaerae TaxID=1836200 RepID=A0ABU8WQW0_9BURK